MAIQLRIHVPPHPLIKHWLGVLRDVNTPSAVFRSAMTEMGRWLTYEAIRNDWLPILETTVETPLTTCPAAFIHPETPVMVVPILRAGLALMEGVQDALPTASVYHLGFARNEATLEAECYVNKLPEQIDPTTRVLISEPMLATGGTIMATMAELTKRGVDPSLVRIVSVVTAPPALQKLAEAYPQLVIYAGIIDEGLDENGFIVPGLGDAGDRTFGTN
ncbi:uracil phosphoribosyltransferase [Leptolyngbya cf. ectocarpi LEGE 11479]|uniref:Uracil phosphoribosyltransferase n=1 Tax=Leptolyngbya cf. ectocarpi LEGE 11479 TaxID=1828722 RepID=A0A928ZYE0_LEPEC|nr:uracil phosphoribosyltransferase [Leptolyngbya ectocarpi]MBE9069784.1 uracil phosphoribosyltransferase [Leptolyngbya cf. ectocarpi LEGE 11479]